jgi:hypothetical protein
MGLIGNWGKTPQANPVDDLGWSIPKVGTKRRAVYDLCRNGQTIDQITAKLGVPRKIVQIAIAQLKSDGAKALERIRLIPPFVIVPARSAPSLAVDDADPVHPVSPERTEPIALRPIEPVRDGPYRAGTTREEAQAAANRVRDFWFNRGYFGIKAEPIFFGNAKDNHPLWGIKTNIGPKGFPPRHVGQD